MPTYLVPVELRGYFYLKYEADSAGDINGRYIYLQREIE